jgi:amino acid adenylation domain-containing protein
MSSPRPELAGLSAEEKRSLLTRLLRERASAKPGLFALSHGQRALWFLHQLAPESVAYNIMVAWRVRPSLDPPTLQRCLQALVERHASLRTVYEQRGGVPFQWVGRTGHASLDVVDATEWTDEILEGRLVENAHRPFDLERGPLLRLTIYRRAQGEQVLLLAAHHIAVDMWSLALLLEELAALLQSEREGAPAALSRPHAEYVDFVRWQTDLLSGPRGTDLEALWRRRLAGELPATELPTDFLRPSVKQYDGRLHAFRLDADLTRALRGIAAAEQRTLFAVVLAGFLALVHRCTGDTDLLVGTPTSGRTRSEFENVVGHFTNAVPVRVDASGDPPFRDFLRRVAEATLEALEQQDFPMPLLVDRLKLPRDPSRSPLFGTMFSFHTQRRFAPQHVSRNQDVVGISPFGVAAESETALRLIIGGLTLESFPLPQEIAQLDLNLQLVEAGSSLSGSIQYDTALFERESIEVLAERFETLLRHAAREPTTPLSCLPISVEGEMLAGPVGAGRAVQAPARLPHELFEAQVARTPQGVAVIAQAARLSFEDLERRSNRLAHRLLRHRAGPEKRIAILLDRSPDLVVALLAILKSGAAAVPLDPCSPRERLAYLLRDAAVTAVVADGSVETSGGVAVVDVRDPSLLKEPTDRIPCTATGTNLVCVLYTSGSSGVPKGAMITAEGLTNCLRWFAEAYGFGPSDRLLHKTNPSFDVAVWEILVAATTGMALVVAPPGVELDPERLTEWIERKRVTCVQFVPSVLAAFLATSAPARCATLRQVICGGEALPPDVLARANDLLDARIDNLYGPTETTVASTASHRTPVDPRRRVPIGRPIANTTAYVLDGRGRPLPVGVTGELYLGGLGVARGYLNRPGLTAERFLPDPFSAEPGARMYRTGDLARYRADGELEFLGRRDRQVKLRGVRVELGEIEAALRAHPQVSDAAVVLEGERLLAYVVTSPEHPGASELRSFLAAKLPRQLVPAGFTHLPALPLLPTGKLDRAALPQPARTLSRAFVPASSDGEQKLTQLWAEVLEADRVGLHDNFFELGGDSITAMRLVGRAAEAGMRFAPQDVFIHQTIAELKDVVQPARRADPPSALPYERAQLEQPELLEFIERVARANGPSA